MRPATDPPPSIFRRVKDRYLIGDAIASGGMATVHYGVTLGERGFRRIVAIKRLHETFARDPEFRASFLDEARIASRIRHPNVISVLDVVEEDDELYLVMEYVPGETLSRLLRLSRARKEPVPFDIAATIVAGVLAGLHAAHEATDDQGQPLQIVHRDVSPQNILIGVDGVPHVVDFGIARAVGRANTTTDGRLKGKLGYLAPEQLLGKQATRQSDLWSTSVVLWELLSGERLFGGSSQGEVVASISQRRPPPLRERVPDVPASLEAVVERGLMKNPERRFETAKAMAQALEEALPLTSPARVGAWVEALALDVLSERSIQIRRIEGELSSHAAEPQRAIEAKPAAAQPAAKARNRLLLPVGMGVVLVCLAVLLGWRWGVGSRIEPERAESAARSNPSTALPPPPPTPTPVPAIAAPSTNVTPSVSPADAAPKPVVRPASKRPPTKGNTRPCFYKNSEGIRVPRPECMK